MFTTLRSTLKIYGRNLMRDSPISSRVRGECYERDRYLCQNPKCPYRDKVRVLSDGRQIWKHRYWSDRAQTWRQSGLTLHHALFRSQYKLPDCDEAFNLLSLCLKCHYSIHHDGNNELRNWCDEVALARRPKGDINKRMDKLKRRKMKDKSKTKKKRQEEYRKSVKEFKRRHNNLTPSQYRYRQMKEWRRNKIDTS